MSWCKKFNFSRKDNPLKKGFFSGNRVKRDKNMAITENEFKLRQNSTQGPVPYSFKTEIPGRGSTELMLRRDGGFGFVIEGDGLFFMASTPLDTFSCLPVGISNQQREIWVREGHIQQEEEQKASKPHI